MLSDPLDTKGVGSCPDLLSVGFKSG